MHKVCRVILQYKDVILTNVVRSTSKKARECSYNASEHLLDATLVVIEEGDAPRKKRKITQTGQQAPNDASDVQIGGRNDESVYDILSSCKFSWTSTKVEQSQRKATSFQSGEYDSDRGFW